MNSKQAMGGLVLLFTMIMIGIVFIQATANTIDIQTDSQPVINESINIGTARNTVGRNDINQTINFSVIKSGNANATKPMSGFVLLNGSGYPIGENNYSFDVNTGKFTIINGTYMVTGGGIGNQTYASYRYYDINYIIDNSSRNIVNLILIFAVVALLIFLVVEFLKSDSVRNIVRIGGH